MASQNLEKVNLLKAHTVTRDRLQRAKSVIRAINSQLLDALLGSNSCQDNSPFNKQRKEEQEYLNVFLNQEELGAEVLQHFRKLISQVANSNGLEENSGIWSQISTSESIRGNRESRLVPYPSLTPSTQNSGSRKRMNTARPPEVIRNAAKQQNINTGSVNHNDEIYNVSNNDVDEVEFAMPPTPQPPGGVTPRHTSLSSAEYAITTNDRVGSWIDSQSQ